LGIVIAFTVNIIQSLFEGVSVVSNLNPLLAVLIPIFFIYILSVVLKVVLRSDS
jgi:lipopolysaccharide export LptBFGC system permease protein LptF